jgi:hypothetical protein
VGINIGFINDDFACPVEKKITEDRKVGIASEKWLLEKLVELE